ncbi:hypothetical protein SKAU_G00268530 [Synaphobranchus kaupii]|uniref:Uncharacterized protein n=1 Tax=Synaphobranchus kaupii TaxID=118154 RepID=A0A9Q1EZQ4_SYNKA|nr:hypothetical protein SKAU_G00268530 [Synaphobranchus kaupii]
MLNYFLLEEPRALRQKTLATKSAKTRGEALGRGALLAHPEGQVARWLELQGYDFEIWHRAGRLHGNADALSRRPCAAQECRYYSRQEERDQVSPDVAVVQASGDAEGWLTPMELREAQEADSTLGKVRGWLGGVLPPAAEPPPPALSRSGGTTRAAEDGPLQRESRMPGRERLVVLHQDRLAPYRPLATPDAAEPEVSSDTVTQ